MYTNVDIKDTWNFLLFFLMLMISALFGGFGFVRSLHHFIEGKDDDEETFIWFFIFIIIWCSKVFIPFVIILK